MRILVLLLALTLAPVPVMGGAEVIDFPGIGEVDIGEMPLIVSTVLIAAADGFNPCSIWVLLFLLGMIIHTRSRKIVLLVGTTFLLVTAAIYGLFISGVLNVIDLLIHIPWIKYMVAGLAAVFGVVNIKDYFWYKRGISFSISEDHRSRIARRSRALLQTNSTTALIGGTALLAAGVAIVELPCSAGLPLLWGGMVASADVTAGYPWYLACYIVVYLAIEIVILAGVAISLQSYKMSEFAGRVLKLIGGVLILTLGIVLVVDQGVMHRVSNAFAIIFGAILLSLAIIGVDRIIRGVLHSSDHHD